MNRYLGLVLALIVSPAIPNAQAPCGDLKAMTTEQRLTLDRCIPFGSDVEGSNAIGFRAMMGGAYGWAKLYGYPIQIVVSSDAGRVTAIRYEASLPPASADSLLGLVENFYAQIAGESTTIVTNTEDVRAKRWSGTTCDIGLVTLTTYGSKHHVLWTLMPPGTLEAALQKQRE